MGELRRDRKGVSSILAGALALVVLVSALGAVAFFRQLQLGRVPEDIEIQRRIQEKLRERLEGEITAINRGSVSLLIKNTGDIATRILAVSYRVGDWLESTPLNLELSANATATVDVGIPAFSALGVLTDRGNLFALTTSSGISFEEIPPDIKVAPAPTPSPSPAPSPSPTLTLDDDELTITITYTNVSHLRSTSMSGTAPATVGRFASTLSGDVSFSVSGIPPSPNWQGPGEEKGLLEVWLSPSSATLQAGSANFILRVFVPYGQLLSAPSTSYLTVTATAGGHSVSTTLKVNVILRMSYFEILREEWDWWGWWYNGKFTSSTFSDDKYFREGVHGARSVGEKYYWGWAGHGFIRDITLVTETITRIHGDGRIERTSRAETKVSRF